LYDKKNKFKVIVKIYWLLFRGHSVIFFNFPCYILRSSVFYVHQFYYFFGGSKRCMSVHVYIYKISVHNRYGGSSKFGTKNEEHTKAVGTAMWHFFN